LIASDRYRPFGAGLPQEVATQGSQSLTLGLILTAAPQLVAFSANKSAASMMSYQMTSNSHLRIMLQDEKVRAIAE
jgi:hypothetical protein